MGPSTMKPKEAGSLPPTPAVQHLATRSSGSDAACMRGYVHAPRGVAVKIIGTCRAHKPRGKHTQPIRRPSPQKELSRRLRSPDGTT
eukprot:scaffold315736_cov30-Tisochrysis_lutea.AAC.2